MDNQVKSAISLLNELLDAAQTIRIQQVQLLAKSDWEPKYKVISDDAWGRINLTYKELLDRFTMQKQRPAIVCLCGSTRFRKEYEQVNYEETLAGKIVLSVGCYAPFDCTPEQKIALDELHKKKIHLADEILIINVGSYIGESTKSEIEYAVKQGKLLRWLEPQNAWLP